MKKKWLLVVASIACTLVQAAEIKIALDSDPVSLDPYEEGSTPMMQMANLVFDPLVRKNSQLEIEPRLAKRWEQINPTTTRFYLRKGVQFHSGNPMTADDVIWTFKRARQSMGLKGMFVHYETMNKIDDYTVDLIAKYPYPLVLASAEYLFVMDSKYYSGTADDGSDKAAIKKGRQSFASQNASGTGVFTVAERQQGIKLVYVKNPNYWGSSGNIEKVTLLPIAENATRVSALLAGDVDIIAPVPPTGQQRIKQASGKELLTITSDRIILMLLNQKVVPAFKEQKVRQAIVYAVNNKGIADKIMRGFATPAGQNSPKGYAGHDDSLTTRFNLEKAQQLMNEAGYENGFTISMIAPNNRYINDEKIAQAIVAMLKKINISVNLITMPKAQYWTEFDKCENGMQMIGISPGSGDSANYSEFITMTRSEKSGYGQYNCGYFSNTKLDELVQQANTTLDIKKRAEILRKVSRIEYNEAAILPLHWENLAWGYDSKVTNLSENINLKNQPYLGDLIVTP